MSFKTTNEILRAFTLWTAKFTLHSYRTIFTDPVWYNGYINSLRYVLLNILLSVSFTFSRYRFLGDKHLFF